jgi:hypothetical protein
MGNGMRSFAALVALFYCLATELPATAQGFGEIGGTYSARGTNPNGSTYYGTVIIKSEGDHYQFTWLIAGNQTIKGVGVASGNTLVVEWGQKYPVIYNVGSDGLLRGKWDNGRAIETLTPMR